MADVTITGLPNASTLDGTERVPMDQAGVTVDATTADIAATVANSVVIGKVLTGYASGAGTVAATDTILQAIQKLNGNDSALLVKASNLSDLTSASTARTNLGLGTLATQSGTFSGTSSGTNTGDQDLSGLVQSNITGITGADAITNIVSLTEEEYDAIVTPNASTLYVITD